MEVKTIVEQIQQVSITKQFWIMEQVLKSLRKEGLSQRQDLEKEEESTFLSDLSVNEKSLSKDWLSTEDNRWDNFL